MHWPNPVSKLWAFLCTTLLTSQDSLRSRIIPIIQIGKPRLRNHFLWGAQFVLRLS